MPKIICGKNDCKNRCLNGVCALKMVAIDKNGCCILYGNHQTSGSHYPTSNEDPASIQK